MKTNDLLLVIDMQNVYQKGQKWACLDTMGAAARILRLLQDSRCKNVIFTRFLPSEAPVGVWKDYNLQNDDVNRDVCANEMLPEFVPWFGRYPLYTKSVYSSLAIPEVLAAAKKADRVVLSGVVAECCVLFTAFSLIDEGIDTVYLTDGVSGLTKEKEEAAELVLSGLSPLHVKLMTVKEYLEE